MTLYLFREFAPWPCGLAQQQPDEGDHHLRGHQGLHLGRGGSMLGSQAAPAALGLRFSSEGMERQGPRHSLGLEPVTGKVSGLTDCKLLPGLQKDSPGWCLCF